MLARRSSIGATLGVVVLVLILLPAAAPVHAATVTVTSTADTAGTCPHPTDCTLRTALAAAAPGDTIQFAVSGTILLGSTLTLTKDVTIQGPGAASLALDGQNARRVFSVNSGVTATISGLTIQHGRAAGGDGGGIHNEGTLTVANSTIRENTAFTLGGGIYNTNNGTLTVTNSTVSGNTTELGGGGIYSQSGFLTVTDSTVSGNTAEFGGGGIYINIHGSGTITGSTISGNTAERGSGGIVAVGSSVSITHSTIVGNTSHESSGALGGRTALSSLTLVNSIVAGSITGHNCANMPSDLVQRNNLSDTTDCFTHSENGSIVTADLHLGPLALNAPGTTMTHALLLGSPAIDGVTVEPTGCGTTITTDQRGVPRPQVRAGPRCDIGAYELAGTGPAIGEVGPQVTAEDTPTGAIPFTVSDPDTDPADLVVTAISSNQTIVPNANIVLGGGDANRTATITPLPDQHGPVDILLTVSDGFAQGSTSFTLTVTPAADPPVISPIADLSTPEDTPTAAIPFTVADDQTPPGSLTVTATSNNQAVVPNTAIQLGGSGAARTIRLTPAANQSGPALIDVAVSDGTATTHETFTLTVSPMNDAPTATNDSYSVAALQIMAPSSAQGVLANDTDVESSPLQALLASQPAHGTVDLRPDGSFTYTPHPSFAGTDTFTYRASDGSATSQPATVTLMVEATQCAPRPRVIPSPTVGGGKLNVRVEATPLNTQQNNPLQRIVFDRLDNARVTLNGQNIDNGHVFTPPPNTHAVTFTVERVTPGRPTTVHFTVKDGCGEWETLVGGGTSADF